jgi:hypothetical protein
MKNACKIIELFIMAVAIITAAIMVIIHVIIAIRRLLLIHGNISFPYVIYKKS